MTIPLQQQLFDLIVKTSTGLPEDVLDALHRAEQQELPGSSAREALADMLRNVELAERKRRPVCQDTGSITFHMETGENFNRKKFMETACQAVCRATDEGILRQNCVDTLTGRNTGNNLGYGNPLFLWHDKEDEKQPDRVTLLLKGGGSENAGCQYSLPDESLQAGRDWDGVRRCVLDALWQVQGRGCAPGILGIAVGGDRGTGYTESKYQLLRKIGERSPHPELASLEEQILREANELGIGPMGFGGRTTLLDVFIGCRSRLPACFFVSISYMCWCCRRRTMLLPDTF